MKEIRPVNWLEIQVMSILAGVMVAIGITGLVLLVAWLLGATH